MPFARSRATLRRFLRRSWSAALVGVLAVAMLVGVAVARGYPAADLQLNDGSVWVVNQNKQLVGKLNKVSDELELSAQMVNRKFDLFQEEGLVLTRDRVTNQFAQIDPTTSTFGPPVVLPGQAGVAVGGGRVAISDPASGRAWSRPAIDIFGLDFVKARADLDLGPGGLVALTGAGDTLAVSVTRKEIIEIPAAGLAPDTEPETTPINGDLADPSGLQLSAVAGHAVLLDRTAGTVRIDGGDPIPVPGAASAQLQASSEATIRTADARIDAVIATGSGLKGIAGKTLVDLGPGAGTPIQPVVVNGCAYGAFTSGEKATVTTACDRTAAVSKEVPSWTGGQLDFRVNRDVVVLNDANDGNIWLVTEDLQLIKGWDKVTPPAPQTGDDSENDDEIEKVSPERKGPNRPPVAVDDRLSVRTGRATMIPIIENDSDPDGDILTVEGPPKVSGGASLQLVRGGTAVQITVPEDAPGTLSFGYTINDGRGGEDSARVSLDVRPADQRSSNEGPVQKPNTDPLQVTLGGEASRRVLLDWRDPEGDDLFLVDAKAPGDDEVRFTPDGQLTFLDVGKDEGRKEVEVTVSDGVAETTGKLVVDAKKNGDIPPRANGDYLSVAAGEEVVVKPMENDEGDDIIMSTVETQIRNATVTPNYTDGTFRFRSKVEGSYYVGYVINNRRKSFGVVRIDVRGSDENGPPVAARDVALLSAGGTVLVDPLANDEDPDDDVLVLQSIGQNPQLRTKMINRQMLEISATSTPDAPITLPYTVSDGAHSVQGTLVVVPTNNPAAERPTAKGDTLTVRAGDVGAVRVLANDASPAGRPLTIDAKLPEVSGGAAWVDGEYLRFAAPKVAGEYRVVYQIRDDLDETASATVRIDVVADEVENTAPKPPVVEGRVLAGTTGRIPIEIDGIDPEGDAVRLLGLDSGPTKGRLVKVDQRWLEYEAYPGASGTDRFTYSVIDARGAKATGEIRVGVVPRGATNAPPTPVDDEVTARPGATVRVAALANDLDPEGDAFGYAPDGLDFPAEAKVVDDVIEFTVPQKEGTTTGRYTVRDSRGAEAVGDVYITVDGDAPKLAPVARDDQVAPADVIGEDTIEVPVLRNDFDPDGPRDALTVSVPTDESVPEEERPVVVGQNVRVTVGAQMRQIRYTATDADGLSTTAAITVPGRADTVPTLKTNVEPQEVIAGKTLELDVNDFVLGTRGRQVKLTSEDRIWASNGSGGAKDADTVTFAAPADYEGPAAVVFEVTDGTDTSDESGRTAVLTIPITVLPPPDKPEEAQGNRPPEVTPLTLNVGAGEDPKSLDLTTGVTDPDGDKVTIGKLTGDAPKGVKLDQGGTEVTASAAIDAEPNTTARFTAPVEDGEGGTATLELNVVVKESSKPPPKAVDDSVKDAVQGRLSQVSVLENDSNPFPDKNLTVVATALESGSGSVENSDSSVTVTPAETFVGTMVVRYTIEDATRSTSRRSEARIRLTVRGKPGKPGVPRVDEVGDRTARLIWTAPADNGEKITTYTVTGTGQNGQKVSQGCTATTCSITGLTNDVKYTFAVTATNSIGESEPSGSSAEVRPDVKPGKPGTPQVTFGDKELSLKWTAAPTKGSAIQKYVIEISGADGVQQREVAGGITSYTWSGLTNGQAYQFRIQARNKAPDPSDWSSRSKAEVPAGKPAPGQNVRASEGSDSINGENYTVAWDASPDPNGDAVSSYTVYGNGKKMKTVDGDATSTVLPKLELGTSYTFTVSATNKAGEGGQSAASAAIVPYDAPTTPAITSAKADHQNVTVAWSGAESRGHDVVRELLVDGQARALSDNPQTVGGLAPGSHSFQIRACSANKCSSSGTENATTWTAPNAPSVSAQRNGDQQIRLSWSSPGSSNGAAVDRVQIRIDGGGWTDVGLSGNRDVGNDYEQTHSIAARAVNSHGDVSPVAEASERTANRPDPKVSVFAGQHSPECENTGSDQSGPCKWIGAQLTDFAANTSVDCRAQGDSGFATRTITTDGNGSYRFPGEGPYGSGKNLGYFGNPGDRLSVKCNNTTGTSGPWPSS